MSENEKNQRKTAKSAKSAVLPTSLMSFLVLLRQPDCRHGCSRKRDSNPVTGCWSCLWLEPGDEVFAWEISSERKICQEMKFLHERFSPSVKSIGFNTGRRLLLLLDPGNWEFWDKKADIDGFYIPQHPPTPMTQIFLKFLQKFSNILINLKIIVKR